VAAGGARHTYRRTVAGQPRQTDDREPTPMIAQLPRTLFDGEHGQFRDMVREFVAREVVPHLAAWDEAGIVDRSLYRAAGRTGLLGLAVSDRFGGGGVDDFRFSMIIAEELCAVGATAVSMCFGGFNDLVAPYLSGLGTVEQQRRWLPGACAGDTVTAIALTEPGAGSDLRAIRTHAVRDGDHYRLNGSKTFVSNGSQADLVLVAAKTGRAEDRGQVSLFVVERDMPGFHRGRKLDKVGLDAQDTAELFFDDVRVPGTNLLGEEGHGLTYLMRNLSLERMSVTVAAMAATERTLHHTLAYTRERSAFGRPIADFQHNRFTLAELATEIQVGRVFVDRCVAALVAGALQPATAAMAKLWVTELQQRVVTRCLQLHGGYGYMREYPVARDFLDARASTLYAGTSEIMKEIIARTLAGPDGAVS
jgi:long-chain-acyl-CoA dehydrogenase